MKCHEIYFLWVKERRHCLQRQILQKSLQCVSSKIAPSFTMIIATSTMKLGVLDISDLSGARRTGGAGTLKWDGSWFSIPLQLLLGKHLGLPVWIDQGADLCRHLQRAHEFKDEEGFMSTPLLPQGSTPRKELGSIPLLLRNKEPCRKTGQGCSPRVTQSSPPWRRRCSPRRPRESIPSQGRSSRQGNNPRWGPCGTPRILFSWAHFLPCL